MGPKIMKKISSIIMAVVLTFSVLWIPTYAETAVTLTPDGTAGNADVVYIQLSDGTRSGKYQPVDGSVKLDGATLNNEWELDYTFTYAGWSNVYFIKLTHIDTSKSYTFQEGSILTIEGTFKNTDDNSVINIPTTHIKCTSPTVAWEIYVPTTEVTVTPDGTAGNANIVYIQLSDGTQSGKYQPVEGSVKLDGATLNNEWELDYTFTYAGWSNVYYIQLTHLDTSKSYTFQEGSILTIGGTFKNTDDDSVINIATTHFICHVSGDTYSWSVYVEQTQLAKPVITISGDTISWGAVENATNYEIYVDGEKKAETTETSYDLSTLNLGIGSYSITVTATGGENTLSATSDAETYEVAATKVTVTPNGTNGGANIIYMNLNGLSSFQKYVPAGGSVKLNGTELRYQVDVYTDIDYAFLGGWSNVHYIQLTNSLGTEYKYEEGSKLTVGGRFKGADGKYIDIEEVTLICHVSGDTYSWSVYVEQTQLAKPVITISGDTISWEAVDNATKYEINVDGEKKAETTETSYDLSTLGLGYGSYSITVTATGGENTLSATSDAETYEVAATRVTVKIAEENGTNTDKKVLYLKFTGLTATKYAPVDGYVKLDGATLRYTVDAYNEIDYAFNQASGELYYIKLTNTLGTNYSFKDKSIVTIGGTFKGDDGSYIYIEETNLVCNSSGGGYDWSDVILRTPGDLNDDGAWTSKDLVRFKRYLDNGAATNYKTVTDLNGDGDVDADDVTCLREIILGKYQVIDGTVVTKYMNGSQINIFADGPVEQYNESLLKNYYAAGFTTLLMTEDFTPNMGADGNTTITNSDGTLDVDYANCIKTAMKYGDVMVRNHGNKADYFTADTYLQLYNLGVRQFYIWDEPAPAGAGIINTTLGDIPTVATIAESFANTLPSDAMFHVNLLPSYGTKQSFWNGTITHTKYVDQYVSDVMSKLSGHGQTLSIDNYPLLANGTIRTSYLSDLWYIANQAKAQKEAGKNVVVNYCVQAYKDTSDTTIRVPESRADISFQTNTGLALGAQSFEYFEYYDWNAEDTITGIVTNGLYDAVKSVNCELKAWDHIFTAFDWQGVKAYGVDATYTSGVTQLESLSNISVSASQATLVGEYKYGDAEYGYMITNFTEPSTGTTDTVTLTLSAGQRVLVYKNGIGRWMTANAEGKLELVLEAGGGAFVIPTV